MSSPHARRWPGMILAAFVVLVGLALPASAETEAPPPKSAPEPMATSTHAWNRRDIQLAFPTRAGAVACVSRDIRLNRGYYSWYNVHFDYAAQLDSTPSPSRYILLAGGTYHWKDCLVAASGGGYTYFHDTYLRQKATGGYARLKRSRIWSTSPGTYRVRFGSTMW